MCGHPSCVFGTGLKGHSLPMTGDPPSLAAKAHD